MKDYVTHKVLLIVFVLLMTISAGKHCYAGRFSDIARKLEQTHTEAEKTLVKLSDGNIGLCYEIYMGNETQQLCERYVEAKNKAKDKCLSKRIDGDETQAGIKEIYTICNKEGNKAGENAAKWFIRKKKILKPFLGE